MDDLDDFSLLTTLTRRELVHVLESIAGTKELVVEPCLMRPLDRIASMSVLTAHGCVRVQQLHAERALAWEPSAARRVFLCRPSIGVVRKCAELMRADPQPCYALIFVDRVLNVCLRELERAGVVGLVECTALSLLVVPLESDLFSLELPQPTARVCGDQLAPMARALWQIQSLYGHIPAVYGCGARAAALDARLRALFADAGEPPASADRPISHMLMVDRALDMPSALLTCM